MASPSTSFASAADAGTSDGQNQPLMTEEERKKAARIIQRNYRGHRTRRQMKGLGLDASTRWMEAVREAQYREHTKPHSRTGTSSPSSAAKENWRRVGLIARRAGEGDHSEDSSTSETSTTDVDSPTGRKPLTEEQIQARRERKLEARKLREKNAKMMDLQYFLEMVDVKHRYGSNLRTYHSYWKAQNTNENFFYWLDYGDGKNVELPTCTREKLERERIRYLSREERLKYLVEIDEDGRLRWARNNERIWTNSRLYRDSVDGIVPIKDKAPSFRQSDSSSSDGGQKQDSKAEAEAEAEHYVNHDLRAAKGPKKIAYISASTLFDQLLKHSVRGGKQAWIFVADTSFRLYIGIKQSGSFQHSSFLHGSRVSAAGLIKVKDGQLRSLSPLSGHYRPPTSNFRAFVHSLKDAGVDMSRVSISKSYAVLLGLEGYVKAKRKIKRASGAFTHGKDKALHPEKVRQEEEERKDKSQSAELERRHLQRLREEKEGEEEDARRRRNAGGGLAEKKAKMKEGLGLTAVSSSSKNDDHGHGHGPGGRAAAVAESSRN